MGDAVEDEGEERDDDAGRDGHHECGDGEQRGPDVRKRRHCINISAEERARFDAYCGVVPPDSYRAFIDESSAVRSAVRQEYLVGAALIPVEECDEVREHLRALALPGQVKLHWTDESEARRRMIVERISQLAPITVVVTHVSERLRKNERCRRKCLEVLYHDMAEMQVFDLLLERRSDSQDKRDREHIVALQGQGLDRRVRIAHRRGGDEPLLWIPDILLGAINAAELGQPSHLRALEETIVLRHRTADSLAL